MKEGDNRKVHTRTWNKKNRVIKLNSRPVYLGMPSNLANSRNTIGRSIMSTASSTGGRIPLMMPTTISGSLQIHASQPYCSHNALMLETAPTNATGNAQSRMRPAVAA